MREKHWPILLIAAALSCYLLVYVKVRSEGLPVVRRTVHGLSYSQPGNHLELRSFGNRLFAPLRMVDRQLTGEDIDFVSPGPMKFKIPYRYSYNTEPCRNG